MADTKRPTAQDIEDFRQVLDGGMRQSLGSDTTTPDHAVVVWQTWVRFTGVLDYAADCLRAEEEAERVPEDSGPPRRGDVWYCWDGLMAAVVIEVRECGGWNVTISGRPGITEWSPESVAAVQDSLTWERVRRGPPEVEVPEDAGGDGWIAWEGGECPVDGGVEVVVVRRNGRQSEVYSADRIEWHHYAPNDPGHAFDIVRYRLAQPSQPPTDPEARVRAMSDGRVEIELIRRGVGLWMPTTRGREFRLWLEADDGLAVGADGWCWDRDGDRFDEVTGDTTTPEGRAECSRRLLVHLLRAEVQRG